MLSNYQRRPRGQPSLSVQRAATAAAAAVYGGARQRAERYMSQARIQWPSKKRKIMSKGQKIETQRGNGVKYVKKRRTTYKRKKVTLTKKVNKLIKNQPPKSKSHYHLISNYKMNGIENTRIYHWVPMYTVANVESVLSTFPTVAGTSNLNSANTSIKVNSFVKVTLVNGSLKKQYYKFMGLVSNDHSNQDPLSIMDAEFVDRGLFTASTVVTAQAATSTSSQIPASYSYTTTEAHQKNMMYACENGIWKPIKPMTSFSLNPGEVTTFLRL